jgi:hypothetical protein
MGKITKFYADLIYNNDYLISNFGEIIKKSTWKFLKIRNGSVVITVKIINRRGKLISRRKHLTIDKLLKEHFTALSLFNFSEKINENVKRNSGGDKK